VIFIEIHDTFDLLLGLASQSMITDADIKTLLQIFDRTPSYYPLTLQDIGS